MSIGCFCIHLENGLRLTNDIWEESHKPSPLDRSRQRTLMCCGKERSLTRKYASVRVKEALQKLDIFVVDMFDVMG